MTIKTDDLKAPAAPKPRPGTGVVVTGEDGVPRTKTPRPALSTDNLDLSPEAEAARRKAQLEAIDKRIDELALRIVQGGGKIYPRKRSTK